MRTDPEFAELPENKLLKDKKRLASRAKVPENVVVYNKDEEAEKQSELKKDAQIYEYRCKACKNLKRETRNKMLKKLKIGRFCSICSICFIQLDLQFVGHATFGDRPSFILL